MVFHSRSGISALSEVVVEADFDGAKAAAEHATLARTAAEMVFMVKDVIKLPAIAEKQMRKKHEEGARELRSKENDGETTARNIAVLVVVEVYLSTLATGLKRKGWGS
jgi:hypothetical protein